MMDKMGEFKHQKVVDEFEWNTKEAGRVQIETLRRILVENGEAEYLQTLGLNGRTDPESFKSCVPLSTHKDLESYIQRIADGDDSLILTGKRITSISLSSGTAQGRSKFVPFNEELVKNTMQIFRTSFAFRNREYPVENGKALQFVFSSKQFETKGGLLASTGTTNVYRSEEYKNTMKDIKSQCSSPDEVIFCPDFRQSLYCHLLCGIIHRDEVQFISSAFAHTIVLAFGTFEHVWEEICNDVRKGVLSSSVTIPSIRIAVSELLQPSPELADSIYQKCSGTNWFGIIPAIWPNAKYVYSIMTGSMEHYLKKLRHYAGDLPLLSADYGASEGWIGVNVHPRLPPEMVTYVVVPDIGYYEFIPLREKTDEEVFERNASTVVYMESKPVGLTEVKVGEEYEIIITNFAGLYRYRLGDVVKVMGFYNSSPELQFVCRRSLLPTINIDKNTEKDLQLAVGAASKLLAENRTEVIDFTSHVDLLTEPGHYVFFWELSCEPDEDVLGECANCLDRSFIDAGYVSSRKVNAIGPLELRVVQRGTFQKILEHYLGLVGAVSQFKMPRCVGASNKMVLQILSNNVVQTFFSTAFGN